MRGHMDDANPPQPQVTYEADGRIAYLTLDRPEKLNAMSVPMRQDFHAALDRLAADDEVRVAILRGAGRAFCVGFDLSSGGTGFRPRNITPWDDRERLRQWTSLLERIWSFPKPIIAQVHGFCMAGGVLFPLVADITIIADDCRVGWPKLPMGSGFVAPLFARVAGPGRAKMMEYVGGSEITGRKAADWGYAAEAVPAAELETYCRDLARNIAKMPSQLLHLKKAAINRVFDLQGFTQTLLSGTEWDTLAHEDHDVTRVREWVREDGMKEAIARFQRDGL